MRFIGLSGSVGVGKDTIADYLVAEKGFLKFSFSDALYAEVSEAFDVGLPTLKTRATKEEPTYSLSLRLCKDTEFVTMVRNQIIEGLDEYREAVWHRPRSPREILQLWGTLYRREQDPDYWVKKAEETVTAFFASLALFARDGSIQGYRDAPGLVNTSVRFPNERALFDKYDGEVWHVYRPGYYSGPGEEFESELTLPIETGDRIMINNSNVDRLSTGVDIMLRGNSVVAVQSEADSPFVPVFYPRHEVLVARARAAASEAHHFFPVAPPLSALLDCAAASDSQKEVV